MAVAYQSIASVSWQNSATTVISKPSGVVDGDQLVAVLAGARNGGVNPSMSSAPAGWTLIHSTSVDSSTGILLTYYKIASSEGSNWTWTWNSASPDTCGAVIRVDGGSDPSALAWATDDGTSTSDATPTYAGGVTPQANSLLVFAAMSKDAGASHSAYSLATSNPSWDERLDIHSGLGTNGGMSIATASRPEATATGDFSMTVDSGSGSTNSIGHLIAIPVIVSVTVSPTVMSVVSSVLSVTVTGGATATPTVVSVTATVQAPTVSTPANDWTNTDKNSSSWTNQDKS